MVIDMAETAQQGTVGQIGLGIMGGAFARHLLAAGHRVIGYDPSQGALRAFAARGGRPARSAAEVAAQASILITSLPSPGAMEEAYLGEEGIAAGARPGTVVIEASTMTLALKEKLRRGLARRRIEVLDCPISGTGAQAAAGDIAIYASGRRRASHRCRSVFDGSRARPITAARSGWVEAQVRRQPARHDAQPVHGGGDGVGEKAGLDLDLLYRVISDGAGRRACSRCAAADGRGRYLPAHMKSKIYQKDIDIIRRLRGEPQHPTPLFEASLP